ncbi:hypothetical protein IKG68_01815 [Candidatus Saccharibacteria bacterium]|nr:hypothetical protein [Candidatus Saccharibacteria bacterium]
MKGFGNPTVGASSAPNPSAPNPSTPSNAQIKQLEKLLAELKKEKQGVPAEMVTEFGTIKAVFVELAKMITDFDTKLHHLSAGDQARPVFGFRFINRQGKEDFLLASEPDAELKARRYAEDGTAEFGYAYPQEGKDGEYYGFTAVGAAPAP